MSPSASRAATALSAPVFHPASSRETRDHDVLLWSADSAFVVEAHERDHLATTALAVLVPAGIEFAVAPLGVGSIAEVHLGSTGREQVAWFGVGSLLRELLIHLDGAPPGARRERAKAIVADAADPVDARELLVPCPTEPRLAILLAGLRADPGATNLAEDWAERLGVSVRTLSRLCAEQMQLTFGQWRSLVRTHASLYALARGVGVSAVARHVGYASTSAFIAAFRKDVGVSPGALSP